MLRLSIVIPVLRDPRLLDDTLVSVLENRPANSEILVVHRKPYDDPYELAGEVRFLRAGPAAGFVECVRLGLAAARAPVVHVLTCGVEVRAGWADAALRHFRNPEVAAVAPVVLHHNDPRKVASAGLGYRAEGVVWRVGQERTFDEIEKHHTELCGPDTLAAFYRASAVEAVGGFSPGAIDVLAAADVALRLRCAGFRCVTEPKCVARAGAAIVRPRPGFRHGRDAERLFWRWASPHGRARSWLTHAALVAGECAMSLWRPSMLAVLLGRLAGMILAATAKRRGPPQPSVGPSVVALPRLAADHRRQKPAARAA